MSVLLKKNEDGEIRPSREELEAGFSDLGDVTITRSRAIKLAGAALAGGAFSLFWAPEADARTNKNKRRRRRRARARRRRRRAAIVATPSVVNITIPGAGGAELVTVTNNGTTPVTISPEVVGDGFTLGDLSGLDLELDPNGGFVNIPVIATADAEEGVLNIRDASDDLILEVVELNGPGLLP
jgi:hypothetical protein